MASMSTPTLCAMFENGSGGGSDGSARVFASMRGEGNGGAKQGRRQLHLRRVL
jgi:hypothetical protein